MTTRHPRLTRAALTAALVTMLAVPAAAQCVRPEETRLRPSGEGPWLRFGAAVALTGDLLVVGAPGDNQAAEQGGAVHVYERVASSGGWAERQKLLDPAPREQAWFGAAVAADGDTILVGAWRTRERAIRTGGAVVYRRDAVDRRIRPEARLRLAAAPGDHTAFGATVAVRGDVAAVGAPELDHGGARDAGAVVVYRHHPVPGGRWREETRLAAPVPRAGERLGWALALDGDLILIGRPASDEHGAGAGSVLVFRHDAERGTWDAETTLFAPEPGPRQGFGAAVALSGSRAVIGAPDIEVSDREARLSGFTITRAVGGYHRGGGIDCDESSPTITDCVLLRNRGAQGSGIRVFFGALRITGCVFVENIADETGAALYTAGSRAEIAGCTFIGNTARWGGGAITAEFGESTIRESVFEGNSARFGGSISNIVSSPVITGCRFDGNVATLGGGAISNWKSHPRVSDCVFTRNLASDGGGGGAMHNQFSGPVVTSCEFRENAAERGGALFNARSIEAGASPPRLADSFFCGNGPDDIDGPFRDDGGNVFLPGCPEPRERGPRSRGDGAVR